ncbi:hypothetical protein HETIRDRAFT_165861 [Heterobasidion irregulare TC 32-1]|uniref:NmrA-like domain-containing protein n=1 Tax=Heterobasidion irregulare (strain TC 32-1) TaxID=747525 RepID=W4KHV2_HETIT|nr:uncharacterized protein HETIRDRAFT_165861 [Heterobasidion irregulare TC 32-1]ETW84890.1 hypothetical protein HETIRDRAFT_165861 [Heterobasidion irregulare TC 32-1]
MSYTTSAHLSRGQISIAIAGGTGSLGREISTVFLTAPYRVFFSQVIVFTRDINSASARALAGLGAVLHQIVAQPDSGSEDKDVLRDALRGVDAVINALGGDADKGLMDRLFDAALASGVAVYFPSEFGADHRLNNFPGFEHEVWAHKREHAARARARVVENSGDMKIIAVYVGWFMEEAIRPIYGFDTDRGVYTCYGSPSQKFALTSKADVARAVAELSILSMSPVMASSVPDHVRIAGQIASYEKVKDVVKQETGIEVTLASEDLRQHKVRLEENRAEGPIEYIRVLMGEGKLDFSGDVQNELVNPDERSWKWKTLEDEIREVKGGVLR